MTTVRLTAVLTGLFCLVVVVQGILDLRQVHDLMDRELRAEQEKLGQVLAIALSEIWTIQGPEAATGWLARAGQNRQFTSVRVVCESSAHNHCDAPRTNLAALWAITEPQASTQTRRGTRSESRLLTYVPLPLSGNPKIAIELERTFAPEWEFVVNSLKAKVISTALVILLFGAVAYWINRRLVAEPVQTLIAQADRAAQGETVPLPIPNTGEPAELAQKIHTIAGQIQVLKEEAHAERKQKQELEHQLRHANRLASVGTLAAGLIHDLGTPLNVISGRAVMIEGEEDAGKATRHHARIVYEQATRIAGNIRSLLTFARTDEQQEARADARKIVAAHLELVEPIARKANVKTALADDSEEVELAIGPTPLRQILNNFIMNAVQAMPTGGRVTVGTGRKRCSHPKGGSSESEYGFVYVQDEGIGITVEQRQHLFEAFYTTKSIGQGSGLGLSVCRNITQQHHGWIEIDSTPGQGSRFTAYFPQGVAT